MMASQLSNVNMSSVPSERGSEVGGLQGTSQNLGASLGTALIGSILIASLVANYQKGVLSNPALSEVSQQAVSASETNANFVTTAQFQASAEAAGLTSAQTDALVVGICRCSGGSAESVLRRNIALCAVGVVLCSSPSKKERGGSNPGFLIALLLVTKSIHLSNRS